MGTRLRIRRALAVAAALASVSAFGTGRGPLPQGRLVPTDGAAGDTFGATTAVSGDTALVSAYTKDQNLGAAYVFRRSGAQWTQEAKLVPADPTHAFDFGLSVAIDGDTAVLGASPTASDVVQAAYVFTRTGTVWAQQQKIVVGSISVPLTNPIVVAIEGDTLVVGSTVQKKAFVYTRAAGTWTERAQLTGSDAGPQDGFGTTVAISGGTILVGAYGAPSIGNGAAY